MTKLWSGRQIANNKFWDISGTASSDRWCRGVRDKVCSIRAVQRSKTHVVRRAGCDNLAAGIRWRLPSEVMIDAGWRQFLEPGWQGRQGSIEYTRIRLSSITCSAMALSRVLRTALVPYGNIETSTPYSFETSQGITMKLCRFDYVCKTNTCAKFGCNPPARGRSTNTWNMHFLWVFFLPSFLLYCLFFLRTSTDQTDRYNFTHNGLEDAFWRKEVPSQQVFFSHLTFWG